MFARRARRWRRERRKWRKRLGEILGGGNAHNGGNAGGGPPQLEPDETIVAQVISMGFSENAGKRAALATQNANAEMAINWIMEHMDDPDLNDPPVVAAAGGAAAAGPPAEESDVNHESLAILMSMGFDEKKCRAALKQTGGSPDRAADFLFSHPDFDPDAADGGGAAGSGGGAAGGEGGSGDQEDLADGPGKYKLLGFVSHVGKQLQSGHYVAHIKKDGQWCIFNDEKVAKSVNPPFDYGFMYFFKRA